MPNPRGLAGGLAAILAVAVIATLIARLGLTASERGVSIANATWIDFRFFTIWSNALIGVVCVLIALRGRTAQWLTAGSALSIALVAGVYHALLAAGRELVGLDWAIDFMLHTAIPIGFITFWTFYLPKDKLVWRDLIIWSGYPILYAIYAIARGSVDGTYPYFFLNIPELGAFGVAAWVAGLAVVFMTVGAGIILATRMARARA